MYSPSAQASKRACIRAVRKRTHMQMSSSSSETDSSSDNDFSENFDRIDPPLSDSSDGDSDDSFETDSENSDSKSSGSSSSSSDSSDSESDDGGDGNGRNVSRAQGDDSVLNTEKSAAKARGINPIIINQPPTPLLSRKMQQPYSLSQGANGVAGYYDNFATTYKPKSPSLFPKTPSKICDDNLTSFVLISASTRTSPLNFI